MTTVAISVPGAIDTRRMTQPPADTLVDIGRAAARIVALERVVLPTAEKTLPDGAATVDELRRAGRALARGLHRLDRHLTGDLQSSGLSTTRLRLAVGALADEHARLELDVRHTLAAALGTEQMAELSRDYHAAMLAAPTRPHPDLPVNGPLGRLAGVLAARVDRFRDALDNRPVTERLRSTATDASRALDPEQERHAG